MQRWFKVDADDGRMYVLRHDEATGDWELAALVGEARDPSTSLPDQWAT